MHLHLPRTRSSVPGSTACNTPGTARTSTTHTVYVFLKSV